MSGKNIEKNEIQRLAQGVFNARQNLGNKIKLAQNAMGEVDKAFSSLIGVWENYSDKKDEFTNKHSEEFCPVLEIKND